jgi:hypothetical protein
MQPRPNHDQISQGITDRPCPETVSPAPAGPVEFRSLPQYPLPSLEEPEGERDWGMLLSRLMVCSAVAAYVLAVVLGGAYLMTCGRILHPFGGGR